MNTQAEAVAEIKKVGAIALPDTATMAKNAGNELSLADTCVIESAEDYAEAAKDLQRTKAQWKEFEGMRTAITVPQNQALRLVNALFAPPLDYLARAEGVYKRKMLEWTAKQEAIAAAARIEAEKVAAAARLAAEMEAKRIEEEAAAVRRQQAEEAAKLAAEGKAEEAAVLTAQGDLLLEAAAQEAAAQRTVADVIVAAAPPPPPRAAGISSAKANTFTVDLPELIRWVAKNMDQRPEVVAYLVADQVTIRAQVRATGEATTIGGVTVQKVGRISVR